MQAGSEEGKLQGFWRLGAENSQWFSDQLKARQELRAKDDLLHAERLREFDRVLKRINGQQ